MADIDLMPSRGVPFRAQVGPTGIALGGTLTIAELAQRGMRPVCVVDNAGLNAGVTVDQLAQRGIRAACLVDENGLASGVSADELRRRGIRPLVQLTAAGLSGSTTMLQLAQRGQDYACLVNESGAASGGGGSWVTTFSSQAFAVDGAGWNGYTLRVVLFASLITTSGAQVRVSFRGATAQGMVVNAAWFGHSAGGATFDGTQVQMKVAASNSFTVAANTTVVTDPFTYALDETKAVIISFYLNGVSTLRQTNSGYTGADTYWVFGNDASTTSGAGYSSDPSRGSSVLLIEVQ